MNTCTTFDGLVDTQTYTDPSMVIGLPVSNQSGLRDQLRQSNSLVNFDQRTNSSSKLPTTDITGQEKLSIKSSIHLPDDRSECITDTGSSLGQYDETIHIPPVESDQPLPIVQFQIEVANWIQQLKISDNPLQRHYFRQRGVTMLTKLERDIQLAEDYESSIRVASVFGLSESIEFDLVRRREQIEQFKIIAENIRSMLTPKLSTTQNTQSPGNSYYQLKDVYQRSSELERQRLLESLIDSALTLDQGIELAYIQSVSKPIIESVQLAITNHDEDEQNWITACENLKLELSALSPALRSNSHYTATLKNYDERATLAKSEADRYRSWLVTINRKLQTMTEKWVTSSTAPLPATHQTLVTSSSSTINQSQYTSQPQPVNQFQTNSSTLSSSAVVPSQSTHSVPPSPQRREYTLADVQMYIDYIKLHGEMETARTYWLHMGDHGIYLIYEWLKKKELLNYISQAGIDCQSLVNCSIESLEIILTGVRQRQYFQSMGRMTVVGTPPPPTVNTRPLMRVGGNTNPGSRSRNFPTYPSVGSSRPTTTLSRIIHSGYKYN